MKKDISLYINTLEEKMVAAANPENAAPMQQYMRNQFRFLGIKTPERRQLVREFVQENGLPDVDNLEICVDMLWKMPAREFQYVAMELLAKQAKKLPEDAIIWLERWVTNRSWWDSVDVWAGIIGVYFEKYPHQIAATNERWITSGNIWLQRCTLIFQLRYKQKTNQALLFENIRRLSSSKEFFIQKAIGWSLRQYARVEPVAVQTFVDTHTLAPLSRREALKHLI